MWLYDIACYCDDGAFQQCLVVMLGCVMLGGVILTLCFSATLWQTLRLQRQQRSERPLAYISPIDLIQFPPRGCCSLAAPTLTNTNRGNVRQPVFPVDSAKCTAVAPLMHHVDNLTSFQCNAQLVLSLGKFTF